MFKLKSKLWLNMRLMRHDHSLKAPSSTRAIWAIASWVIKFFLLLFFGGIVLFPFFYMISWALMSNSDVQDVSNLHIVPSDGLHWENFALAFEEGYWLALLITLFVTTMTIALKTMVTVMMGYAFAYQRWFGKRVLWYTMLTILMVPEIALLVGQYKVSVDLKLHVGTATLIAMVLPFIAHIFSAFMFRNAFEAIPDRIKEAALVDGASELQYFVRIALPMIRPTIWTVAILTTFATWNAYMWPQLLAFGSTKDESYQVLGVWLFTTGRIKIGDQEIMLSNIRMAASIIVSAPMIIIYFIFRKKIMGAISRQGATIKG